MLIRSIKTEEIYIVVIMLHGYILRVQIPPSMLNNSTLGETWYVKFTGERRFGVTFPRYAGRGKGHVEVSNRSLYVTVGSSMLGIVKISDQCLLCDF